MAKPVTAADIMVRDVISCTAGDTMSTVRLLMRDHGIRHIPIVNDRGGLDGVVTQKAVLREAIKIANKFGIDELDRQEKKTLVEDVMDREVSSVSSATPLAQAGRFFMQSRHGCLPLIDDGVVVGILTSADFVRLSVELLESVA